MMRGWATVLILIALAVLVGSAGAGDRDIAELLFGKGEKAYRKKAWKEAAEHYGRALEEHSPYPEAAHKLGMALEKLGNGKEALDAYLLAEKQFDALEKLTRKQIRTLGSVRKAIGRLGAGYAELKKYDDAFVKGCVAFCRRHFNQRPSWAKRACESALAIDPANRLALGFREKLGETAMPAGTGGVFAACILDDRLSNWDPGVKPPWTCSGGVMTHVPYDKEGRPNFVKERLTGDYEIRARVRTLERGKKPTLALMFGRKQDRTVWSLGLEANNEFGLYRFDKGSDKMVKSKILDEVELKRWYRIAARVQGGKLTALLEGKVIFTHDPGAKDAFDGNFGVIAIEVKAEVKDVEVRK